MKVSYRTVGEIWGSFEAPFIGTRRLEIPGQVEIAGADTQQAFASDRFTKYVGDAIEYSITKNSS